MKTAAPQILIVDDDQDITTLLRDYLARFGLAVHIAADGDGMRRQMARHPIALLVLDIMLPGTDGLALAREVRAASPVPIIMLTARGHAFDRVLGLEIGADDYMAKPFEPRELVARIQTVLRRVAASPEGPLQDVARFDGWAMHRQERRLVSPQGVVVPLSNAEYRLLCVFLASPGRLMTRDQLMEQARGRSMDAFERSIDLLVSRLRQKLGGGAYAPALIKTVRGAGYIFDAHSVHA
ncbi:response regulator [Xylophilus ampelinus]|uniref:Winged helix family two component transcriptional regulator n=1 Tax=Xylophilus ampelinus TaxID=54067 RepID=A0A318SQL2_9BURK|nr:response regulator transcription factor [Xylophilus ampelinus]MCS4511482.1 response regulator transcription factor [Xylophilus ampelinus]PYE74820.1 winged helix family two component transcriptional regulator [Xylophilus ampelinus]